MTNLGPAVSSHGLDRHAVHNFDTAYWNLDAPALYEMSVRRGDGVIAPGGALVVQTGHHTGRSPKDKFIVDEPSTSGNIAWGDVNVPMSAENYRRLYSKVQALSLIHI